MNTMAPKDLDVLGGIPVRDIGHNNQHGGNDRDEACGKEERNSRYHTLYHCMEDETSSGSKLSQASITT